MLWLFVTENHQVMFIRKSADIRTLHGRIRLCMVSFFLLTWALFLLANCAATCVKNVFIYNCSSTVGRYYFSLGATWILYKCRSFLEWTRMPVTSLRLYLEEFISSVCWLAISFVKVQNLDSSHTISFFCGGECCMCDFWVEKLQPRREKKAGEQFLSLTEASLDSLSRFPTPHPTPDDFVWNGGSFCMFVCVWHKWTKGKVHWRMLWWSWNIQLCHIEQGLPSFRGNF